MRLKRRNKLSLIAIAIILILGPLAYFRFIKQTEYQVGRVIDGDTIELKNGQIIRYIGIDTPELGQGKNKDQCFAQEAKEINRKLVENKKVKIVFDKNEMDQFGRYLAYVYQDKQMVNQVLLDKGAGKYFLDTVNISQTSILIKSAEQAYENKQGLWQACAPDPSKGCLIKGNIDKLDKRWYHLFNFRHYQQTIVNLKNGDRWFCTEEEAREAGFEKARE